jgi:hypothetical protein
MTPRDDDGNSGDVLSSLPAKRPQRPSPRRAARNTPSPERKPAQRSAAPKASAASSKPSTARPARSRPRSSSRAKGARKPAAVRPSVATSRAREPGPRAVPRSRRPEPPARPGTPQGLEIVTTAVQAAGELAQIGLALGAGVVRGAIRRLPRP